MLNPTLGDFLLFQQKGKDSLTKLLILLTQQQRQKSLDACPTRWIQHVDAYVVFLELLLGLQTTLQAIIMPRQYKELGTGWSWDGETITKEMAICSSFNPQPS